MIDPGDADLSPDATNTEPAARPPRPATFSGALVGLCILAVTSFTVAVLDENWDRFEDSTVESLLVTVILGAYVVAGWAGSRDSATPLRDGSLAAGLAFALWIPLRVLVWIVRDDDRGLIDGDDPVFTLAAVIAQLVLAAGFGMLGAFAAQRARHRVPNRP